MNQNRLQVYVIAGLAGSGKTRLIRALHRSHAQVIDLEKLARHRGSVFGRQPGFRPTSAASFRQAVYAAWGQLNRNRPVFVESEGPFIGNVDIPKPIYREIQQGQIVRLHTSRYHRIQHLLYDYGHLSLTEIHKGLEKLSSYLGPGPVQECHEFLQQRQLAQLADRLLDYYDASKRYQFSTDAACEVSVGQAEFSDLASKLLYTFEASEFGDSGIRG